MRIVFLIAIALVLVFTSISSAAEKQNAENLIIKEMVALDKAFKTTIDAVVLNRLDKIAPAFEDVHKVREEVEKTVKEGKKIALPKNQERFKLFVSLDNRFHKEVEILIESAKKNHTGRVQKQTNRLLGLCVRCHAMFRK
jgi:cytochrome c556